MKITGLKSWQILQQKNGYADAELEVEITEGWLHNPQTEHEKQLAPNLKRIRAKIVEENTGLEVTDWIKSNDLVDFKCTCCIKNIPAGGLYRLIVENEFEYPDGELTYSMENGQFGVRHFGVGDLFLIAGQSNAAGWAFGEYDDGAELGVSAYMDGQWELAVHPLGGMGVGPFLSFAKYLKKKLGYPIGLIPRAVGGVPITTWVKGGVLTERLRAERDNGLDDIKAVMWYQGCSDTDKKENVDIYESRFENFLNEMREIFDNKELPIVTFQLNRLCNGEFNKEWAYNKMRDIQRQIADKTDNCYIIPTIDLTHMSDCIHNGCSDNYHLGIRAAKLVLYKIYKLESCYLAPVLKSIEKLSDNEVVITFDNVAEGLESFRNRPEEYPVEIIENNKSIAFENFAVERNIVKITLAEKLGDNFAVNVNCGINPGCLLVDYKSKLPVLCTYEAAV